jgi:hypothetical protein
MGWAAFWAIFSQTHLVTLVGAYPHLKNSPLEHFFAQ